MKDHEEAVQPPRAAQGDGWDGILQPGEEILWQGRPDPAAPIGVSDIGQAVFGLFFAGFALFWMAMAAQAGGFFWAFGLLHFSVGVGLCVRALMAKRIRLSNTWYTLTNQRAFIATDMPIQGKRLKSWEIDGNTVLTYDSSVPPSIGFGFEERRLNRGKSLVAVGFERISEGQRVYGLMQGIKDRRLAQKGPQG